MFGREPPSWIDIVRPKIERVVTTVTLQALGAACVYIASFPRGTRRRWSRYRPWDLLKSKRIASRLRDGDRVLDVGCGSGHTLAQIGLFREIAPQGVELEIVPGFPEIPIAAYDGRTLPFPDKSFDATLACYVLHHLTPGAAVALVAEIVRVTRRHLVLLEDSLPVFGALYRLRNRLHRIEAGLRYRDGSRAYRVPPDESMFMTHEAWRAWLAAQPGIAAVELESLADISMHDHHTLIDATLAG